MRLWFSVVTARCVKITIISYSTPLKCISTLSTINCSYQPLMVTLTHTLSKQPANLRVVSTTIGRYNLDFLQWCIFLSSNLYLLFSSLSTSLLLSSSLHISSYFNSSLHLSSSLSPLSTSLLSSPPLSIKESREQQMLIDVYNTHYMHLETLNLNHVTSRSGDVIELERASK